MLYEAETPEQYWDQLEDDWRRAKMLEVKSLIRHSAPDIEEVISYKMLGFRLGGETVFHLNAQRQHVGLYVGHIASIDPDGEMLSGFAVGKGCIRIRKTSPVKGSGLEGFIAATISRARSGDVPRC